MPHDLRIIRPAAASGLESSSLESSVSLQQIDPERPLLHPVFRESFRWGGQTATIHAQRKDAGSMETDDSWFYLELPDGTFHEVQFSRLRIYLDHPPELPATPCIARAFEAESHQSFAMLLRLARVCGLAR